MCNIFGAFVSSMPTTGSFTRSAVNNASGVRTTLGGIVTGSLVLLSLGLLTQTFYYIPKAVLAAVIISAVIAMVEVEMVGKLWRTKRKDIFCLYGSMSNENRSFFQVWISCPCLLHSWHASSWGWSTGFSSASRQTWYLFSTTHPGHI